MKKILHDRWPVVFFAFSILIAVGLGAFYYFKFVKGQNNVLIPNKYPESENILPTGTPTTDKNLNLLLLGYGGGSHDGTYLTDTIILADINPTTKTVNLISIPRDLWVPIPTDGDNAIYGKINSAYAIGLDDRTYPNKKVDFRDSSGGGNLSKYVVSQITGLNPNYYISVDFAGFSKIIDLLGGVDVNIPVAFDDYFYPVEGKENETCGFTPEQIAEFHAKYTGFDLEKQFTCRYEHLHFDQKITHMNGELALKFVRSRHSDQAGTDFARSQRQQSVLNAVKNKVLSLDILNKANPIYQQLTASIKTDADLNLVEQILKPLGDINQYKINNIYLTDQNVLTNSIGNGGQYILIPKAGRGDFSGVIDFINQNIQ